MPALPLAGPSSPLRSGAEVRRIVNWEPVKVESGTGKGGAQAYLKQVAGLRFLTNIGTTTRALKTTRGRLFAVNENKLIELSESMVASARGSIAGGDVVIDDNETQLCIAVGAAGYAFDLSTASLTLIAGWPNAFTVGVLDGWGILIPKASNKFQLTANQDFTSIDALQFASAESSPGDIVGALTKHRELILLKERSGEVWYDAGSSDFPLARNDSAVIEIGCGASKSLQKVGGVAYWLGTDDKGKAVVFGMVGYEPTRVSSDALEERLATIKDLSGASAWTYHQEGQSRYVLNVPGLDTTWVYNVAAGIWHERGDWIDGVWTPWRATCHAVAFGMHIVGDAAGNLYELSPTTNTNHDDPLRRLWRSPHNETPQASMQRFSSFEVLCDVGNGLPDSTSPTLLMRYSNDGGSNWESWIELPLGAIGESLTRTRETQLGSARDRVWEFVVTDDVQCGVITALVNEP